MTDIVKNKMCLVTISILAGNYSLLKISRAHSTAIRIILNKLDKIIRVL
jgi:hypothetical protein